MFAYITKRNDEDFKWIVGHTLKIIKETEDGKGYYVRLGIGACRVEKEEVEVRT